MSGWNTQFAIPNVPVVYWKFYGHYIYYFRCIAYLCGMFMNRFHHLFRHGHHTWFYCIFADLACQSSGVGLARSDTEMNNLVSEARELVAEAERERANRDLQWKCVTLTTLFTVQNLAFRRRHVGVYVQIATFQHLSPIHRPMLTDSLAKQHLRQRLNRVVRVTGHRVNILGRVGSGHGSVSNTHDPVF